MTHAVQQAEASDAFRQGALGLCLLTTLVALATAACGPISQPETANLRSQNSQATAAPTPASTTEQQTASTDPNANSMASGTKSDVGLNSNGAAASSNATVGAFFRAAGSPDASVLGAQQNEFCSGVLLCPNMVMTVKGCALTTGNYFSLADSVSTDDPTKDAAILSIVNSPADTSTTATSEGVALIQLHAQQAEAMLNNTWTYPIIQPQNPLSGGIYTLIGYGPLTTGGDKVRLQANMQYADQDPRSSSYWILGPKTGQQVYPGDGGGPVLMDQAIVGLIAPSLSTLSNQNFSSVPATTTVLALNGLTDFIAKSVVSACIQQTATVKLTGPDGKTAADLAVLKRGSNANFSLAASWVKSCDVSYPSDQGGQRLTNTSTLQPVKDQDGTIFTATISQMFVVQNLKPNDTVRVTCTHIYAGGNGLSTTFNLQVTP